MPTLDLQITTGTDDAFESSTGAVSNSIGSSVVDATDEWVGLRFQNVTIPPGSSITAAWLSVVPTSTGNDEPNHTFYGQAAVNPGAFAESSNDISGRPRTTASVVWSSADLGATGSSRHNTPSLVAIVQEIVDLPEWVSGSAIAFVYHGSTSTRDLNIQHFDGSPAASAQLHIEYTESGGGTLELTAAFLATATSLSTATFVAGNVNVVAAFLTAAGALPVATFQAAPSDLSAGYLGATSVFWSATMSAEAWILTNWLNDSSDLFAATIEPDLLIVAETLSSTTSLWDALVVADAVFLAGSLLGPVAILWAAEIMPVATDPFIALPSSTRVVATGRTSTTVLSSGSTSTTVIASGRVSTFIIEEINLVGNLLESNATFWGGVLTEDG